MHGFHFSCLSFPVVSHSCEKNAELEQEITRLKTEHSLAVPNSQASATRKVSKEICPVIPAVNGVVSVHYVWSNQSGGEKHV